MSVNYHAYQNRRYLFASQEALCQQWRTAFCSYDPGHIAGILHLNYDSDYLFLTYFETPFRLRRKDGVLEKFQNAAWTENLYFNESMSIYHLLTYTCESPRVSGVWVPNTALNTAASHRQNVPDPLLLPFAKKFSGKADALKAACEALGGQKLPRGDVGYEFFSFPQIPLRLIFWDADEDFPAQVQMLFDQYVTDYIHFETTGCIVSDLLEKLEANTP